MSPLKLKLLVFERIDVPPGFNCPKDGLLTLRGMLTANQIKDPHALNPQGDHVRRVIKRGFSTNTTVGTLTRFMSFGRKYFPTGNM